MSDAAGKAGSVLPTMTPGGRPSLDVQVTVHDTAALLVLVGELDLDTSRLLGAVLDDLLRTRREPALTRLVVDVAGVSFADVAGLSPLLHARAVLTKRKGRLELRAPGTRVRRLLKVLALEDLLPEPVHAA